jgi:hypothetical protein
MEKFTNKLIPMAIAASLAATLSACGGGGGGTSSTATDANPVITSFPIQQALDYAFTHGMQATLTITGTTSNGTTTYPITGSLTYTLGAAINATFEGAAALQSAESLNGTISANGTTQPLTINGQLFLNTQYAPIGESESDSYCVATNTPSYPATAVAGQSGDIATLNCYADSSKRALVNVEKITYVTTAGSDANSLNFQMVTTDYGLSNTPVTTSSTTYTISAAGIPKLTRVQLAGTDSGISVNMDAK